MAGYGAGAAVDDEAGGCGHGGLVSTLGEGDEEVGVR